MRPRGVLVWLGAATVLATAVVALRQAQPPAGLPARPAAPTSSPSGPATVPRYATDGVGLPEPGRGPDAPVRVSATGTGSGRLRVAWGAALPGGAAPSGATGYEVHWQSADGSGSRLVAAQELQLDGLRRGGRYTVEVRSVDAFGRRSQPVGAEATLGNGPGFDTARHTGLADTFDGPFSVDTMRVGARWHLSGYPGCTAASTEGGQLLVDLECGSDLAVLRARSPLTLAPVGGGERGRVLVVTDAAGPNGRLSLDLVTAPVDRVGSQSLDQSSAARPPAERPIVQPTTGARTAAGTAVLDRSLPDGTVRVSIGDDGARVLTGPGIAASPDSGVTGGGVTGGGVTGGGVTDGLTPAPARGPAVLHTFEIVLSDGGVRVLQDGIAVAAAAITLPWSQAYLLVGISGPPGRQSTAHLEAAGFTGPATEPPPSYTHPVVPSTQRVLGLGEQAPGIGISREQLATAASARLVATVSRRPSVDLTALVLQQGTEVVPARPVLPSIPDAPGAEVTVAADLPPELLGPSGPGAVSPLVLRAPGAESTAVPIEGSYLDIVPLPGLGVPPTVGSRPPRQVDPVAPPRPSLRVLDSASHQVSTATPGSRLLVEVTLDGVGGQLDGAELAGVAGFQLWMDNRQVAGVPTAIDGPGVGGTYRVAVSTRSLQPGGHFIELRLLPTDPTVKPLSVLAAYQLG